MTKPGDQAQPRGSHGAAARGRRPVTNSRGQLTRGQILEIAKAHFGQGGFRGVSTAAIAAEAGVTNPGLLHHFQSKAGLLMALLETRFGRDDEILLTEPSTDGTELLTRLGNLVEENQGQRADVLLFSVLLAESVSEEHPSHEYFSQRFRRARELLHGHLEDAQQRGIIKAEVDTHGLATALLALMDGLQYQWLIDETVDMAGSFRAVASLLADSMVAAPHDPDAEPVS
ncbi:TetR/AcrR family transcriptional regulator [Microbacterium sp. LRZ72]|uniref:TetR/AcrR family transcriptional regulator n=1 Tax=Microbacterium sp. LRZ72 TaxID=2942481 RepID=UPI0029B4A36A|nr:TetR/AcrR family transcriptional regulator [Microbacterium sp. LRZ72]MDX2377852.1 TetR/AcrR family transcriptional regulator [Microbacterium sp. LRZ72]